MHWLTQVVGVIAVCGLFITEASAQTYPDRPIRFILPYGAGGSYDAIARLIGKGLTEKWGQQVVVDNRPGAAGRIGMDIAINAAPDGYTVLVLGNNQTITPSAYKNVSYDLIRDLAPVGMVATITDVLVVHPSVPAKTVAELIALAQSTPGKMNFGSGPTGGITHLAGELFKSMTGVKIVHVPFKGAALAMTGILSAEVEMMVLNMLNAVPNVKANRVRGLAVTSLQRSGYLPNLPTLDEAGLKGYDVIEWCAMAVPARTPRQIIGNLNGEVSRLLNSPDIKETLAAQYVDAASGTPQELIAFLKRDLEKYAKIVAAAGIKPN